MLDFLVWSAPSLAAAIGAAVEREAAEIFSERQVTSKPTRVKLHASFVHATAGDDVPRMDGSSVEFRADNGEPLV